MHILHLSDTHNHHLKLMDLPDADIIIHSGDVSWAGTGKEVSDFVDWFSSLNYSYKIFIAGNHDYCLDGKNGDTIQRFLPENCFYLCNGGITIEGIKFWGVPFFVTGDIDANSSQMLEQIPENVDILITHRPPFGILDTVDNIAYGCPDLLRTIQIIRPRYHLFGHIHDAFGIRKMEYTTFVNASLMNESYELVNRPFLFEYGIDIK